MSNHLDLGLAGAEHFKGKKIRTDVIASCGDDDGMLSISKVQVPVNIERSSNGFAIIAHELLRFCRIFPEHATQHVTNSRVPKAGWSRTLFRVEN